MTCDSKHLDDPEEATHAFLYSLSCFTDQEEFYVRINRMVRATIGGAYVDVSWWSDPMTDEEVQKVFDAFGVEWKNRKGEE